MAKVKEVLHVALLAALLVLVVVCAVSVWQVRRETLSTMADVRATTSEIKQASAAVREFAEFQSAQLQTGENQKLIRQSLAVGAAFVGTARLVNTTVLPALSRSLTEFGDANQELTRLIRHTDASVNAQLLPEATRATASLRKSIEDTARQMNASVEKTSAALDVLLRAGVLNLEDLNKAINDPAFKTILDETAATATEIHKSSANLQAATVSVKDSLQYAPGIMRDVEAFTKAQSKYSKYVILARILRALTF